MKDGTFSANELDWDEITQKLKQTGNIIFGYSSDESTAYVININNTFEKLGIMPFGGNPCGSHIVSIWGRGMYYFDLLDGNSFVGNYVGVKLGLQESEGIQIAELLSEIRNRMV